MQLLPEAPAGRSNLEGSSASARRIRAAASMAPAAVTSVLSGAAIAPVENALRSASFSRIVASSLTKTSPWAHGSPPRRPAPAADADDSHAAVRTRSTASSIASSVARIARAAGVDGHNGVDEPESALITQESPMSSASSGKATCVPSRGSNALKSTPGHAHTTSLSLRMNTHNKSFNWRGSS